MTRRARLTLTAATLVGTALAILLTAAISAQAQGSGTIYVDADAAGAANGTSWTDAYTNVQDALAVATTDYEIWVAEGVYYPDEGAGQTDDSRISAFKLVDGVALYGGFAATETLRTDRDWEVHLTVLSGDLQQDDTTTDAGVVTDTATIAGTNADNVIVAYEVGTTTVVDGFTVTGGEANGNSCPGGSMSQPSYCGGGMVASSMFGFSTPTLRHVIFSGNHADRYGGGMVIWIGNSAILSDVTFVGNTSGLHGGGLLDQQGSDVRMTNVRFQRNTSGSGGGLSVEGSSPVLTRATFISNTATSWGGGFRNVPGLSDPAGSPKLTNVLVVGNSAASGGGGMYSRGAGTPTLTNVTFSGNTAEGTLYTHGGGAICSDDGSTPILVNGIIWGNTATGDQGHQILNMQSGTTALRHTLIQSGTNDVYNVYGSSTTYGPGMLTADPDFVDSSRGNYRLQGTSPAIDAGDNGAIGASTDLDGNPRITGASVDMGAYEFDGPILAFTKSVTPAADVPPGGVVTYTLLLENTGSLSDTVSVSDPLPNGVAFNSWITSAGGTVRDGDVISSTLAVGAGEDVTLAFTASHVGDHSDVITNTAQFGGSVQTGASAATFHVCDVYPMTVTVDGDGAGTVEREPPGTDYPSGTVVSLTAVPAPGSTFQGWWGAAFGTSESITVTVTGSIQVGATFNESPPVGGATTPLSLPALWLAVLGLTALGGLVTALAFGRLAAGARSGSGGD